MKKFIIYFAIGILVFVTDTLSQSPCLKKVTTKEEYCTIFNHLEPMHLKNEDPEIIRLGYDPVSFVEFAFNNSEVIIPGYCKGIPEVELKDPGQLECECNLLGLRYEIDYNNPWISVTVSDLKIVSKSEGTCIVTFKNNKALFFELMRTGGISIKSFPEPGLLLYPYESYKYQIPLKFDLVCKKDYNIRYGFNFSRGEFTGITREEFLIKMLAYQVGNPIVFNPLLFSDMKIGFSNNAVFYNTFNIFWSAIIGSSWKRDMNDNAISALGFLIARCPECREILNNYYLSDFTADFLKIANRKGIDPLTAFSITLKVFIGLLNNPVTRDLAYGILVQYLPAELTAGGAAALSASLGAILLGVPRIITLAPITWDVLWTQEVEKISTVNIYPIVKSTYKNK
ncbi:hypothetical protein D9V86_09995 [Bacteroidetes/Chlorobi group bacterium ChocPot_Mid]|nr:MAG: hypothetical protein D9V86_09995 [Bacteroidetes/Chlorobi group bacterium ChocPot_Mid]